MLLLIGFEMPVPSQFRLKFKLNEFCFHLNCLNFCLSPFRCWLSCVWTLELHHCLYEKLRLFVSQIVLGSGPALANPRSVQPQSHLMMSPVQSDFVLWGDTACYVNVYLLFIHALPGLFIQNIVHLWCVTYWIGWEHYISCCFKITNNLALAALIEVLST